MEIILLGGNSPKNISWLEAMDAALQKQYRNISVYRYSHWDTKDSLIDIDKELEILTKKLGGIKDYVIIGKSAGALLTLKGVYEHKLSPSACIFLGTAILWGREKGFDVDSWLKNFSVPTLFIHKSNDPAIASDALESLLKKSNSKNYKLGVIQGSEHEYPEYQELSQSILFFLRDRSLITN